MDDQKYILETSDLTIGYPDKLVASAINLHIAKGDLVGIIGRNGAGKSTLIRTLARLQDSLAGRIVLHQKPIEQHTDLERATVQSVVLTNQNISLNLSIKELVTLGRQPYTNWLGTLTQTDRDCITNAITRTDLSALQERKLHTLSDGQLQKALIARAIAQDASLIILDEPLSHLDLHHKSSILKLLKSLSEGDKAIVFTTHDISFALEMCTHIIYIHEGQILQSDTLTFLRSGALKTMFPEKHIFFDEVSKTFKIVN